MTTTITATRSILKLVEQPKDFAYGYAEYEATDPDNDEYFRHYEIDLDIFEELGRPEVITVTIEPGDLLNVD